MVQPAAASISASASRNGNPSRAASRRPIEVLPAPISPTTTMLRPASASGNGGASRRTVLRVMGTKASTPADTEAPHGPTTRVGPPAMFRAFLFILAAGLIALAAGIVYRGAFPPRPHVQTVEKALPVDKSQSR